MFNSNVDKIGRHLVNYWKVHKVYNFIYIEKIKNKNK